MKRKGYSEEKIISILKEHEAGASVSDLNRAGFSGGSADRVWLWAQLATRECDNKIPDLCSKTNLRFTDCQRSGWRIVIWL